MNMNMIKKDMYKRNCTTVQ